MTSAPLDAELLYRRCDPASLGFSSTSELPAEAPPIGQERAVEAIRFAIGIRSSGFNLFALGPEGTGKLTLIRRHLDQAARDRPVPDDWIYVHNFDDPHRPRALRLPPGRARAFAGEMERLVEELGVALPAAFEGDEYRTRRRVIEERHKERNEEAFAAMRARAAERDVALIRTPVGLALAPMRDGEVLSPDEFGQLPEERQVRYKRDMTELQQELESTVKAIPQAEREQRDKIRELDREVAAHAAGHLVDELRARNACVPALCDWLEAVRDDLSENFADFLQSPEPEPEGLALMLKRGRGGPDFTRFAVNALVDNDGSGGAPVVHEDHPTQPNLVGRIEHTSQFGSLVTDFTLIKAGALHRANGGYLILDARKLLTQPFAWDDLKRALRTGRIRVESPGQSWGVLSTVSLEPEPIPLDVKVVLTGDPMLYYLLSHHDPEFAELFKVAADFDYRIDRSDDNVAGMARVVASMAAAEGLRPLDGGAVARVIEHAARLAGDAEKVTTDLAGLADLVREADWRAGEAKALAIGAVHVQSAIDAHTFRQDRVREHIQEEIRRGTLLIDTAGEVTGQINGLAVLQLGNFSFGRPSRITCRVHLGRGEVIDIEREVQLGGPLHSKGVMILTSFLASRFGGEQSLSLAANLVFEQSYGGVDGDSASSTELYALLSALAEAPIRQSLAVTGSVNQHGHVQAIGGVNDKIEGFFDLCRARGLTGREGVLIPAANVKHLMLRHDVVEAARQGLFHVHAVETIDQGIEILTGVPAGERDDKGEWTPGSINRRVATRLATFARKGREMAAERGNGRKNGNDR
ncbi:MAG: AAA family ATPase [Alphaproteobacteria bacterium]|nr:AAA family ATPase [Alphaproteobacteria bacterium]